MRETKAHEVRGPEVADNAAFDHRLHHRITLIEGYPDLAAAQRRLARRDDIEARQKRGDARNEQFRERETLLPQGSHRGVLHGGERCVHAPHGNDRLSSAEKPPDAWVGPEVPIEGEWGCMTPPARQWMLRCGLMALCDGNERGRSHTTSAPAS